MAKLSLEAKMKRATELEGMIAELTAQKQDVRKKQIALRDEYEALRVEIRDEINHFK